MKDGCHGCALGTHVSVGHVINDLDGTIERVKEGEGMARKQGVICSIILASIPKEADGALFGATFFVPCCL